MAVIWLVFKIQNTAFGGLLELTAVLSSEERLKSEVLGLAFGFGWGFLYSRLQVASMECTQSYQAFSTSSDFYREYLFSKT